MLWSWIWFILFTLGAIASLFFVVEMFLMNRYTARVRHWLLNGREGPEPRYPFLLSDLIQGDLSRWKADRSEK